MRHVRAYLLALSAADAGALRMLKNGAANILAGTQFIFALLASLVQKYKF